MNTPTAHPSREIDGKGRTVRELLAGRKYSIDYYQREYKWQKKQVADLLDDLAAKFLGRVGCRSAHTPSSRRPTSMLAKCFTSDSPSRFGARSG